MKHFQPAQTLIFLLSLSSLHVSCGKEQKALPSFVKNSFLAENADYFHNNESDSNYKTTQDENNPLNDPALSAVTREFGQSIIDLNSLPFKRERFNVSPKPWSSWWYPKFEDQLFRSKDSALKKYDQVRKSLTNQNSNAAGYEEQNFAPSDSTWDGLCDAWSFASLFSPEPIRPVKINGVNFSIYDLKGLLLKTYETLPVEQVHLYGQVFTGNENGWVYPDIFPDQFHRFIEHQIYTLQKPFIMDRAANPEIWNEPVFGANYSITQYDGAPNSVLVRMWVYVAAKRETDEREVLGTKINNHQYNYILTGRTDSNNKLTVTGGYWLDGVDGINSRHDHPDFVLTVDSTASLNRKSKNPEIDNGVVDKILSQSF